MRRHLAALALLSALASPVPASASAIIEFTDTEAVPGNNDFQADLLGLGYTSYTTTLASITLDSAAVIWFYYLGSESGFNDTFNVPLAGISYQESDSNQFGSPIFIGSGNFDAGTLAGLLGFVSDGPGAAAGIGDDGFGIFLQRGQESGDAVSSFILGYDDHINNQDDNHDDHMILAVIGSAVPEPGTWAMLLAGFGMLGAAMRRKSKAPRVRAAIA
jgi:hypothetical protein